jgi:hypothetical protein
MKISITKISTFLDCPRKYWYTYELGIQTPKSEGFYFGSAIHSGLESYYKGEDPLQSAKQALFGKKDSIKEEAKEGVNLDKLYKDAEAVFGVYQTDAPYFKAKEVETRFEVELVHPETKEKLPAHFVGKIDLITDKGELVDHKTAARASNRFFEDKNTLQANGYSYAYFMLEGKLPERFIFNQIIKGNSKRKPQIVPKILHPQLGDICMFFDTAKFVLDAIIRKETKNFGKCSKWNCRFCSYKNICPYYKK